MAYDPVYQAAYRLAHQEERRAYSARWQAEHPVQYKDTLFRIGLRRQHGITPAEYDAMLAAQSGVCAICGGVNASGHRLAVDHDHRTGRLRMLLCGNCNRGIGYLRDNPDLLLAAAAYIKQFAGD